MALTPKQELFCLEYLKDLNATQAAIRAGYAESGARTEGARLLANADVQAQIAEIAAKRNERIQIDADFVLRTLMSLADFDPQSIFNEQGGLLKIHEMPVAARKAISSFEIEELFSGRGEDREQIGVLKKVKLWSKDKAVELLARHKSLLNDTVKHEHSGPGGGPIRFDDAALTAKIDALFEAVARRVNNDVSDIV